MKIRAGIHGVYACLVDKSRPSEATTTLGGDSFEVDPKNVFRVSCTPAICELGIPVARLVFTVNGDLSREERGEACMALLDLGLFRARIVELEDRTEFHVKEALQGRAAEIVREAHSYESVDASGAATLIVQHAAKIAQGIGLSLEVEERF